MLQPQCVSPLVNLTYFHLQPPSHTQTHKHLNASQQWNITYMYAPHLLVYIVLHAFVLAQIFSPDKKCTAAYRLRSHFKLKQIS